MSQYVSVAEGLLGVDVGRLKVHFVTHSTSLGHVLNYLHTIYFQILVCVHTYLYTRSCTPSHIPTPTHCGMRCNIFP